MTETTTLANDRLMARAHRWIMVLLLGVASGLPLALTAQAMQAWLTVEGVSLATLGWLSLVGMPYTLKFIWAPLLDRFDGGWLGRRKTWLALIQCALAGALWAMSTLSPSQAMLLFAGLALSVSFLSATQDIVIDAYRAEVLRAAERGLGASLSVLGYRLAMIVSGGLTFIWADPVQGGGMSWGEVYGLMAWLMLTLAVISALALPKLAEPELAGRPALQGRGGWRDLLGWDTLAVALADFFSRPGAWLLLILMVLYKLGDAFAGALLTPFLLKGVGYAQAEVGVVNKVFGLWLTLGGAIVGGAIMLRLRLWRSLLLFGVLQALSNIGFAWLAASGQGALGHWSLPPFDWTIVRLQQATTVDFGLLLVIALENITGGMGTAAFVALLMSLCRIPYTATQYALLSALAAVGRVWVGPVAGLWAESLGWVSFFGVSLLMALPGLALLIWARSAIEGIDKDQAPLDTTAKDS